MHKVDGVTDAGIPAYWVTPTVPLPQGLNIALMPAPTVPSLRATADQLRQLAQLLDVLADQLETTP